MSPQQLMRLAIEQAEAGVAEGQSPFGCVIFDGHRILAAAHNTVRTGPDITAHAEINALRQACHQAGSLWLPGTQVATTCEPCPMCAGALHWARVEVVYFGASIQDAAAAGFNELPFSARDLLAVGQRPVRLEGGILAEECQELFRRWQKLHHRVPY